MKLFRHSALIRQSKFSLSSCLIIVNQFYQDSKRSKIMQSSIEKSFVGFVSSAQHPAYEQVSIDAEYPIKLKVL